MSVNPRENCYEQKKVLSEDPGIYIYYKKYTWLYICTKIYPPFICTHTFVARSVLIYTLWKETVCFHKFTECQALVDSDLRSTRVDCFDGSSRATRSMKFIEIFRMFPSCFFRNLWKSLYVCRILYQPYTYIYTYFPYDYPTLNHHNTEKMNKNMVNIWLIYGKYMVNIWWIYGEYMLNIW